MRRTYRWSKQEDRMIEVTRAPEQSLRHFNMTDCYFNNPIKSPIDGSVLASRADLREHCQKHDVVDVGNDGAARRMQEPAAQSRVGEGLRADLQQAYSKIDVCR